MKIKRRDLGFIILILILTTIPIGLSEQNNANIDSFVNDYANILSNNEKLDIQNTLESIYSSGKAEIALVIINSLNGSSIEDYSLKLAQDRLGDKEKNNGLLILISIQDKKYRFEVGRGLEPIFNDAKIGRIGRQYLVPYFKEGRYYKGIKETLNEIKRVLKINSSDVKTLNNERTNNYSSFSLILKLLLGIIFFIIIFIPRRGRSKDDIFVAAMVASTLFRPPRGGFGGGSFGGFGGGSFGGGGAGGGW